MKKTLVDSVSERLQIKQSNEKIQLAILALRESHRGQKVLSDLKTFLRGPAQGLDNAGHRALVALLQEFAAGRRDFVHGLDIEEKINSKTQKGE